MAVVTADHGAVRVVRIDRPERRNALDPDTFFGLGQAFVDAEADDGVRVIVLTGTGDRAFCSGMDLKAFREGTSGDRPTGPGTEVFAERFFPKPVVGAVNGIAVGGGFGLVLACDLVIAADHATFGLPEVTRGLVGAGATSRAALRLPPAVALELALTGAPIDAARAMQLGLVNSVVQGGLLMDTALATAERIAANGPLAVRVAKELVYDVRHLVDGIDIAALRAKAAPVMASDDAKEGSQAFLERRPPRFTGR
jgi:enoyl-CoA hydratase